MPIVKIQRLQPDAKIPTYGTDGAACFDFYAYCPAVRTFLHANAPVMFSTGIAIEVPEGWALLIYSRSGHGFKSDTRLSNCVGVIDSDYRGEIKVRLIRDTLSDSHPHFIDHEDRIAQGMLVPAEKTHFEIVNQLSTTERGAGGFGSTGK